MMRLTRAREIIKFARLVKLRLEIDLTNSDYGEETLLGSWLQAVQFALAMQLSLPMLRQTSQ